MVWGAYTCLRFRIFFFLKNCEFHFQSNVALSQTTVQIKGKFTAVNRVFFGVCEHPQCGCIVFVSVCLCVLEPQTQGTVALRNSGDQTPWVYLHLPRRNPTATPSEICLFFPLQSSVRVAQWGSASLEINTGREGLADVCPFDENLLIIEMRETISGRRLLRGHFSHLF